MPLQKLSRLAGDVRCARNKIEIVEWHSKSDMSAVHGCYFSWWGREEKDSFGLFRKIAISFEEILTAMYCLNKISEWLLKNLGNFSKFYSGNVCTGFKQINFHIIYTYSRKYNSKLCKCYKKISIYC